MKRSALMVMAFILCGACVSVGEEYKIKNACGGIPKKALERAEKAIQLAYPAWGAVPVMGDDGEWRCKTGGAYVKRYDKTVDGKRVPASIPLFVEKDGSIYVSDTHGCFSIDRWK